MPRPSPEKLCLVISMVIFGTIGILRSFIPYPSGVIAFVRGLVGCLFLLGVIFLRGGKPDLAAIKRNLALLCGSGALIGANWVCLFEAYRYTSVSVATMCYYMAPVFVVFISRIVLKERLTAKKLLCAAAALFGMALVSGVFGSADFSPAGVLFGLAAAVMYAWVIILNKLLKEISAFDRTMVQLGTAAVAVLPYVLLVEDISSLKVTAPVVLLLLAAGIIHTGIAYALYFGSIEKIPAQTAALFSYIDPITAVILSAAVLHEKMTTAAAVGAVMVLGAAVLSEIRLGKTTKEGQEQ